MYIAVDIDIHRPKAAVWAAISDIDNCPAMLSAIVDLEVINRPKRGLVGLKWRETRMMFGREASETMWITDARVEEYYATRAESHGSVYITHLSLSEVAGTSRLTMTFHAQPQTFVAKCLSALMALMIKKSMVAALEKDLQDIKYFVEAT